MVTYGSQFEIPLEAKREDYRKNGETIWTAIRSQLAERYVLYPNAHGNGIYLVFWFGRNVSRSPKGAKPKTPAELEDALRTLLTPADGRIEVVVVDCSLPAPKKSKSTNTLATKIGKIRGRVSRGSQHKIVKKA
jgi:hypothetical protein